MAARNLGKVPSTAPKDPTARLRSARKSDASRCNSHLVPKATLQGIIGCRCWKSSVGWSRRGNNRRKLDVSGQRWFNTLMEFIISGFLFSSVMQSKRASMSGTEQDGCRIAVLRALAPILVKQ